MPLTAIPVQVFMALTPKVAATAAIRKRRSAGLRFSATKVPEPCRKVSIPLSASALTLRRAVLTETP